MINMIIELLRAFSLIFFAEMGDKSQLLAMTYATKYKIRNVLIGITIGIFFNHLLAVLLGTYITSLVPIENISIFAGIVFLIFGFCSLKTTKDVEHKKKKKIGAVLTIAIAMFLGELGDKTQLATIILASEATYPYIILFGTVSAMVFTSLFGIIIGMKFGSKIPEFALKVLSSFVFIGFGLVKILENLPSFINTFYCIFGVLIILVIYVVLLMNYKRKYDEFEYSVLQQKAEELQIYFSQMKQSLDEICLGLEVCKTCQNNGCLIGYTKSIIKQVLNKEQLELEDVKTKIAKYYDKTKVNEALNITVTILKNNWNNKNYIALHEIRKSFETILYSKSIEAISFDEYIIKKTSIN